MNRRNKILLGGTIVVTTALAAGGGIAVAAGRDDTGSHAITGAALREASAVALAHTGGGRVSETEAGDEESYYQVEVTTADGSQVDVQLDRAFHFVGAKADRETEIPAH